MRLWRESIEEAARKLDVYRNHQRGGGSEREALRQGVRELLEGAAVDVHREMNCEDDQWALNNAVSVATLCAAWLALDKP